MSWETRTTLSDVSRVGHGETDVEKRSRNAARSDACLRAVLAGARDRRMVTCEDCIAFYAEEAWELGNRTYGWSDALDSLREHHLVCGVDPDAFGAAVAVRIALPDPANVEGASIESVDVFRPQREGNLPTARSMDPEFFGIYRLRDVSCDVHVERGTKMGNFKAALAIGTWYGAISALQTTQTYAKHTHTCNFVDPSTWTSGLFSDVTGSRIRVDKRERVELVRACIPALQPTMNWANTQVQEGIADASLMAVHALCRVQAQVASSCFPRRPIGIPKLSIVENFTQARASANFDVYSVLSVDELSQMLRRGGVRIPSHAVRSDLLELVYANLEDATDEGGAR